MFKKKIVTVQYILFLFSKYIFISMLYGSVTLDVYVVFSGKCKMLKDNKWK